VIPVPRSADRGTRARRLITALGVAALGAGALAGCSSGKAVPNGTGSSGVGPTIPLTSSTVTADTTWATLAMGHLDDPLNTFWQLLALTGGTSWQLATPPGVASNGGVFVAAEPSAVLAGFGPSQYLRFSPLAHSTDQGSSWDPGLLPAGLARVPDALAAVGTESLAVLRTGGGAVVVSTGDLSTWRPVTSARALTRVPALSGCGIGALTAVTLDADGRPLVGASCTRGGQAGLFAPSSTGWVSAGPGIPGVSSGPTEVIRLDETPAGTAALVSAGTGVGARLFGMWSTNGLRTWTVSDGLALDGTAPFSTGVTAAGGFVVATRGGGTSPTASVITPTATPWQALPALPSGTTSVAATPAGGFDALVPVQSTLSVFGLGSRGWARVQGLKVDIQYGSSG
jgi:hypothetical protein